MRGEFSIAHTRFIFLFLIYIQKRLVPSLNINVKITHIKLHSETNIAVNYSAGCNNLNKHSFKHSFLELSVLTISSEI